MLLIFHSNTALWQLLFYLTVILLNLTLGIYPTAPTSLYVPREEGPCLLASPVIQIGGIIGVVIFITSLSAVYLNKMVAMFT